MSSSFAMRCASGSRVSPARTKPIRTRSPILRPGSRVRHDAHAFVEIDQAESRREPAPAIPATARAPLSLTHRRRPCGPMLEPRWRSNRNGDRNRA